MRQVVFSDAAVRLFRAFPKAQQAGIREGVRIHLREDDATAVSRNKFRLRRPSPYAEYELRLGEVRIFYRVRDDLVEIVLIGRKRGNRLVIGGEEFEI